MAVLFLALAGLTTLLLLVAPRRLFTTAGQIGLALLPTAEAAWLIWFVRTDDPMVNDPQHRPRWDFYQGGSAHLLFWITMALAAAAVLLLTVAILRRSRTASYGGTILVIATLVTGALTVFGFTLT